MKPHLHRFTTDDWQAYKSIRLEALQKESRFFGGKYVVESALSDEEWQARLDDISASAYWGLYDGEACIGLTGIIPLKDDPDGACLIASYIRSAYRHKDFQLYTIRPV